MTLIVCAIVRNFSIHRLPIKVAYRIRYNIRASIYVRDRVSDMLTIHYDIRVMYVYNMTYIHKQKPDRSVWLIYS